MILPVTKSVWCWWWSSIKEKKIVTEGQEACQVEQFHQEPNISWASCPIVKNIVLKYLSVCLGVKLVLLPKIATSVKIVLVFLKIFFWFVLILKEYENCPSKKEIETMELKELLLSN